MGLTGTQTGSSWVEKRAGGGGCAIVQLLPWQEVVLHCKKLTKKNKEELSNRMDGGKENGLKALSKEKRKVLEAYQHLFYYLQVGGTFWSWTSTPCGKATLLPATAHLHPARSFSVGAPTE